MLNLEDIHYELRTKAYHLNNLKKYPEALEIYDKLLQINPNDTKILQAKAYALNNLKNILRY